MVALPGQLFYNTQIPACLWFLDRAKRTPPTGAADPLHRRPQAWAAMISRTQRELTAADIARIAVCQVPEDILPARVNQHVAIIRPNSEALDPTFLRYFLVSAYMQAHMLSLAGAGGTRKALTKGMIENFEIPSPTITVQRAIAACLGNLDLKIGLNRQMNETLEAIARAIFKSWFVDFDPVWARLEGRDYPLDAETLALFPDSFEESELGEIPAGWRVGTLGEDFNITMGQSPPGSTYNEEGIGPPFYQGRRDFGFRFPDLRVYCSEPKRFAEQADTLVSVRAPVGDINMAAEKCCIGRGVAAVRHKSSSRSYTYYAMESLRSIFDRFEAEGTVFGSLSKRDFHGLTFLLPPRQIVSAFEKLAYPMDQRIELGVQESLTLAELRDTLLPKLISGELRVPEAAT
jgi:type I restriction enzyme, S subunit